MTQYVSILKKIAADSMVVFIFKMFAIPIAYFIPLVMARLYGAEQLGTYAIVTNLLLTLAVFCRLGLDQGLLRFIAQLQAKGEAGDAHRLLWPALILATTLSVLLSLVIFFLGDWLAQRFHAPQLPIMLSIAAFSLPFSVATFMFRETIKALGGVRWAIFQNGILTPLSLLFLAILFISLFPQVILPARILGLAILISSIIGLAFLGARLRTGLSSPSSNQESSLRELIRYSWPLFLSSILALSLNSWDNIIFGYFNSPEKLAYYVAAAKTAGLVGFPLVAINEVVTPMFARFHQWQDHSGLELVARATAGWTFYLALPLCLLGCLMATNLLHFFGAGFVEAEWALRVLFLAQLFDAACGSVGFILAMTGHQWSLTLIQAGTALLAVPLMAFSSWKFGLIGLAGARGLWIVAANILLSLAVWRHLGIKAFAGKVEMVFVGGIVGLALYYLAEPYLNVAGRLAVFTVGYLAVVARPLCQNLSILFQKTG